jgi:DNA-binding PadR family transcriptional regulator
MKDKFALGSLELKLLLAVFDCNNEAYGLQIQQKIKQETGRETAVGAIYTTLARLQDRKLVTSREGDHQSDRLGRPRRYFTVTGAGVRAIREAEAELRNLGLKPNFGTAES